MLMGKLPYVVEARCCDMVGVKCSGSGPDTTVKLIAWYDLNLTGSIPPELGNLTGLEKL
jgi:hypothetical protein